MKRFLSFLMAVVFGITSAFATTVYCKMTYSWWTTDGAAVAVHYWGGTSTGTSWPGVRMTAVTGEDGMWSADVPSDVTGLIFVRVNGGSGSVSDWGAKTADLTLPTDGKNLYTITSSSAVWGDPGVAGQWSKYEASGSGSGGDDPVTPPTPVDSMTVYFYNGLGWANVNTFVWGSASYKDWPGEAAKKEAEKINDVDVYAYTFPASYANVIFNNGKEQTADLEWDATKPYFVPGDKNGEGKYTGTWYAKADIPSDEPVTPPTPTLANGFYLVGSMTGWAPKEGYLFAANPDNEAEYMLTVTLAENDEFKVTYAEDGVNKDWFPSAPGNFVVTDKYVGEKTIYFNPNYQQDWAAFGGYFYLAENEEQPAAEWAEIIFTAATAANADAKPFNDSVFTVAGSTFSIKCSDAQGKMAVDANNATFGTKADGNTKYTLRLKTGGKTGSSNFMTLTIPADGILRFAALPAGTSGERTVVMKQGDDEIYNQVITSDKNADNYYDYRTVNVKQGTLTLTYPVNGINFYSFAFKAGSIEQPAEDEREKREVVLVPGSLKEADPAMFLMSWTAGKEGFTTKMSVKEVEGDTLYVAQMPKELDSLIFVRCATGAASIEWGVNVWNQSTDQKIACDTATFAGWNDAMFNVTWCAAEPEQPAEDEREKREIVLVPGGLKEADPAMFLMAWTAGKEGFTTKMSVKEVEGDTLYVAQMPKELDSLIFVRCATGAAGIVWDGEGRNVWNQSTDQKIACDTATFAGWNDAMFNVTWCAAEPEQPAEDEREKREVVLVPGGLKEADPAMFLMAWTAGKEAYNAKMAVKKVGEDTLYTVQVPKELDSLIFVRAASGVESWSALVWEGEGKNVWNQSADQKIACDTATFAGWNDAMFNVTWCAAEPEQPEEDLREKREVVLVPGELKTADPSMIIFAWTAGKEAYNAKMAVKKVGEDTLYTVQVPKELDSLIFVRAASGVESWSALVWEGEGKNVWNQSADQKIACDTATFAGWNDEMFNVTWCAAEPEQPAEDEREKREVVLVPGSLKEADPAMFLMSWTAGKEGFTTKMSVKEVEGDTLYVAQMPKELDSLIFVRCATGAAGIVWDGEGKNVWNQSTDQKIACDTATFAGWNDAMFNVTWCAAEPEQPAEKVLPKVGLGANFNGWNWEANLLVPAADSLSASLKVNLGITDTIEFKIVSDGNWLSLNGEGETLYGLHREWPKAEHVNLVNDGRNFKLTTDAEGEYTFTWTYADSTIAITFPEKTIDPEQPGENDLPKVGLGANFNGWNWEANLLTPAADSLSASLKVNLGVTDTIEFKIVSDGNWLSLNGEGETLYGLHREWPKAEHVNLVNDGRNFKLTTDAEGEYTFTWTYADSTIAITFPAKPDQPTLADGFYFVGTANNWTPAAEGKLEKNPDNEAEYMFTTTLAKDDQFKVVYVENGANKDWYGMTPTEENPDGNYIVDENHAGEKTIYFNPAGNTEWGGTIYVAPNEGPAPTIEDGFYFVGTANDWTPSAAGKFEKNPDNEAEYMLTTTLTAGDEFKVVYVENGQKKDDQWYPGGEGNNYIVDAAHAGEKTIYFRPDYQGGEDWHYNCIFVPATGEGLEEIIATGKAAKIIRNGQFFILKGDKMYNATGAVIR